MLYKAIKEAPSPETSSPDMIIQYFTSFGQVFFTQCDEELTKINSFFSGIIIKETTNNFFLVYNNNL